MGLKFVMTGRICERNGGWFLSDGRFTSLERACVTGFLLLVMSVVTYLVWIGRSYSS